MVRYKWEKIKKILKILSIFGIFTLSSCNYYSSVPLVNKIKIQNSVPDNDKTDLSQTVSEDKVPEKKRFFCWTKNKNFEIRFKSQYKKSRKLQKNR